MVAATSATRTFRIEPALKEALRTAAAKADKLMALCDRLEASLPISNDARRQLLDALLTEGLAPSTHIVPDKPERVAAHG